MYYHGPDIAQQKDNWLYSHGQELIKIPVVQYF